MNHDQYPQLCEDDSRLDWSNASYRVNIKRTGIEDRVAVRHELNGASSLADAASRDEVAWFTEVRCPRLLFSKCHPSSSDDQTVEWEPTDVDGEQSYLIPGLVSRGGHLEGAGELDSEIWPSGKVIEVSNGALLARGGVRRLTSLMQSLLKFVADKGLADGTMSVVEDTTVDSPCFKVSMAEDIFRELRGNRDRQVAALIGAFAVMSKRECRLYPGNELAEHAVTKELRKLLVDRGLKVWDEDDFDPVEAATDMEQFVVAAIVDDEE